MKKLYPIPYTLRQSRKLCLYPSSKGFTLAEIVVVMGVVAIAGVIITQIFLSSVRSGTKAQILDAIKQNGQLALDLMDKTIKTSDNVVYVGLDGNNQSTILVEKNKVYTRYKFINASASVNGSISQDNPTFPDSVNVTSAECTLTTPDPPIYNITDTNTKTGASVTGGLFSRNQQDGFKDVVTIQFNVEPGVATLPSIANSIDPVPFSTSIVLR